MDGTMLNGTSTMRRHSRAGTDAERAGNSSQEHVPVAYLVDDDKGVREALAELLTASRIDVVTFASAADYLGHKRVDSAACLILDLQLPDISGLELQKRVSDEWCPPIVFISGRGDVPSTVQAMKAGAIEFLTKPINPEILVPTILAAFARDKLNREKRAEIDSLRQCYSQLSPREREVLPLVVRGLLNKQSAAALGITEVTLQIHRSHIMKKMSADSFADLVRMAERLGISNTSDKSE
jgi:FixJ family two-component response regulator